MTTLLGIVKKLPPPSGGFAAAAATGPSPGRTSCCNASAPADAALNRFEAALDRAELSDATRADLRAEADVLRGVAEMFADRVERVDDLVAEAMSRPDTLHPRVPGVAGNVAAFAAICRFDFDAAHRLLEWAAPYQEMMGPFATVYARCFGGIAARYQLDIPAALSEFPRGISRSAPESDRTRTRRGSRVRFSAKCSTRLANWPRPRVFWTRAISSDPRVAEWITWPPGM